MQSHLARETQKAQSAINWLVSRNIAPTREALCVALAYFDGVQGVCQSLEEQTRSGAHVSGGTLFQIYEKHLAPATTAVAQKMQANIASLLEEVVGEVQAASASTQQHGDRLRESIAQMDAQTGGESIRVVAMAMLELAREAQETNLRLRASLQRADEEMERLRVEMEHHRKESLLDPLTRLPNRRGLQDILQREESVISGDFALLMIDVDGFKDINDSYGHAIGDAALRNVATAVQRGLLDTDKLVRLGGDEFLVIVPRASSRNVLAVAESVRASIEVLRLRRRSDGLVLKPVTASIGVAEHSSGECFDDVLLRADDAVYRAKHAGRNRVIALEAQALLDSDTAPAF